VIHAKRLATREEFTIRVGGRSSKISPDIAHVDRCAERGNLPRR
jgi:hypothetical protein